MKEFAALGSGYRVALRDLEIRGAGDLLGADQSGVLAAVGYDMYTQMLHDAVAMVKGEYRETPRDVQIDLPMDAYLPTEYVPELEQRIDLYRRLAAVRKWALAEDLRAEMLDRYGKPLPQSVENLFRMVGIKLMCVETGVIHIGTERDAVVMRLDPERSLSPQAQKRLTFEAAGWRAKGLPAPAYQPERVTIFTMNVDQPTVLTMLEQVCDRLRTIESEVAKGPKTIVKLADLNRRRDADWRPFGR
jgi:transcription-repair coupling factor (superfamily II helicase)